MMKHARRKTFALLASFLLALVGVWAAPRSSVTQPVGKETNLAKFKSATVPFVEPQPLASPQFEVSQNVIAGGGGTSSGSLNGHTVKLEGTIGQTFAGLTSTSSNGQFSVTGGFWQAEAATPTPTPTSTPTATPTPTPTPTPNPAAPVILIEEGTVNRAVAVDSVTFVRGPFPILTDHNFSADHHTRVILFTSNLGLNQADPSVLTVQAAGFDLLVENVGLWTGVPFDASYIVVRLPDGLPSGDLPLSVTLSGKVSNITILGISPPSTIVIDRPVVFFPAVGESTQLSAQIFDAQGNPLPGSVTWASTAPAKASVDATGRLTALEIGSAQIIAEAAGVRSAPTLVIVAQPQPGALLATDAQVVSVGPPLGIPPGTPPGVGTEYEVTLRGVATPPPGTVVLAAETAPIAGKVVAARQGAAGLVVTLALAPLYQLFSAYDIDWTIDVSAFPLEAAPPQSAQATLSARWNAERGSKPHALAAARPSDNLKPFQAFDCDGSLKPQLLDSPLQLSPEVKLSLVVTDRPGYSKHALEGSATLTGTAGLKLKAGFKATGKCEAKAQIKLPVFGAASVIVMPAVNFGLGAELSGEVLLVQGELGVEGKVGFSPVVGWECGGATPACRSLDDITSVNEFKTKSKFPAENGMQAKVSAHFYILAGLDLAILAGLGNAEILEARIGPKQSFDLAFEEDQAARADYASSYDLKLEGVVEPGSALKKAIEMAIDDDSTGVTFKAKFSTDISESPKGTLSVSQTKVRAGERVDFTAVLDPNTLEYSLLGYNVTGVELYRKRDDELKFTPWKSMSQNASNQFIYRWEPVPADAGKYEFAALVNTQLPVPLLEVAANSIQKVEVSCFGASPLAARGAFMAQTPTCADTWVGTASTGDLAYGPNQTESTLTLKVDTSVDTGDPAIVAYYAEGTVKVRNPGLEQLGCTLTPTQFTFGRDTGGPGGQPGEANLFTVDYNRVPAMFGGSGVVRVTQTVKCPEQAPRTESFLYPFFRADREVPLSADGLTIQDSSPPFYSFKLTRP